MHQSWWHGSLLCDVPAAPSNKPESGLLNISLSTEEPQDVALLEV